jgi:hypothetical protein
MQRLTFLHLGSYLSVGGLGFLLLPEFTLRLLLAEGSYGMGVIVLVGLVPSLYVAARMRRGGPSHP